MLATDVVNVVENAGIAELARMYQLSRRQAQAFEVQARRALANGYNPTMVPGSDAGILRAAQCPQEPADDQDHGDDLETQAHAQARRIKSQSGGVAGASIANLRAQLAVCDRNIDKGYPEWSYQAKLLRRTIELVEGTTV